MKLHNLSSTLDPIEAWEYFRNGYIWLLVNKFYPQEFIDQESIFLGNGTSPL